MEEWRYYLFWNYQLMKDNQKEQSKHLFRAKWIIEKDWIYSNGYYFDWYNYWFILPWDISCCMAYTKQRTIYIETLSRDTLLEDREWNKLWEWDSVTFHNWYYEDTAKIVRYKVWWRWLEDCEIMLHELFEWYDNKELWKYLNVKLTPKQIG